MLALSSKPTAKNLTLLFIAAFLVRAAVFFFYIQHEERYRQPDSNDYHATALSVGLGRGMTKLHNGQPVFWRTPGYPLFLSMFYKYYGIKSANFTDNMKAQKAALWVQIVLCSLIPIIIFFLALSLTYVLSIAWITAWISVIHLGFVLSSTFFLTEGLTLIFFYLFLLFFYKSFRCYGETEQDKKWVTHIIIAALMLAIATWIRPMGQFVALACIILMALFSQESWRLKFKKIFLFLLVFFLAVSPWYIRNYQHTKKWFFCPMFGLYLNSFVAPKVLRSIHGVPFETAWKHQQQVAQHKAMQELPKAQAAGTQLVLEDIAGSVALPIVLEHPFYTFAAWMPEVIKSTFDLYSSQLTAFALKCWTWDPLEEFLGEKLATCLYDKPIPLAIRLLAWLEFVFSLFLWISLFIGIWRFLVFPLFIRFNTSAQVKFMGALWFKTLFLTGSILFMTGGFGYARLRLPVEPLIIMLALSVWLRNRRLNQR